MLSSRAEQLLRRLKAAQLDKTVGAEMRKLARVELLILDDFALQAMDQTRTGGFYELVVERQRKTSAVITSNRDPAEWLGVMSDPLLAQSAVDRLVATSYELVIEASPTALVWLRLKSSSLTESATLHVGDVFLRYDGIQRIPTSRGAVAARHACW